LSGPVGSLLSLQALRSFRPADRLSGSVQGRFGQACTRVEAPRRGARRRPPCRISAGLVGTRSPRHRLGYPWRLVGLISDHLPCSSGFGVATQLDPTRSNPNRCEDPLLPAVDTECGPHTAEAPRWPRQSWCSGLGNVSEHGSLISA
jgi:hypothetical protein